MKALSINFGNPSKWILFGGGQILVDFATFLKNSREDLSIITSPRQEIEILDEGVFFRQLNLKKIKYQTVKSLNEIEKKAVTNALGLSFGAAWIFKKKFIDYFAGRLINVHGRPLPLYRGGGGFSWQILMNDRQGSCLLHQVDAGIDTGKIISQKKFKYSKSCIVPADYESEYQKKASIFLRQFYHDVKNGKNFTLKKQNEKKSTYYPRLNTKINGWINWEWSGKNIAYFIRAFDAPYPGAKTYLKEAPVFLRNVRIEELSRIHPFQSGIIVRKNKSRIFVMTNGCLISFEIFDEKGLPLAKAIQLGNRLYTPQKILEKALINRVKYTSNGLIK